MAGLWTLHGDGRRVGPTDVVTPEERLSWPLTVGIGAQHIVAMFGATFLVPLLTGFPPTTTIFFSGIGTLLFIAVTRSRVLPTGLPSYLGSSFAFISPVLAAEGGKGGDIGRALGGIIAAGLIFILVGIAVDRLGAHVVDLVMPPVVTGAIVALIGLNLAPTAKGEFTAQPETAVITLGVILLATVLLRGFLGRISIVIGVAAGYLAAVGFGDVDFTGVEKARWVGLPHFVGPSFSWHAVALISPVVLVLVAENTGHVKAVAAMTGRDLDHALGRAYIGDGLATVLAGFGGGSGTTTYAENIGVMAATRVYSTAAYLAAGLIAVLLGCVPKFGAFILTIPAGVLGGATTVLYGLIAVLGGRIWVENRVNFADPVNLMPAAAALVVGAADYTWSHGDVSFNGIALGSFVAIVAYHVMRFAARRGAFGAPATPASEPVDAGADARG